MNRVYVCAGQSEPPPSRFIESLARLEVPLSGCYETEVQKDGRGAALQLEPGAALFVPPNGWNRPIWSRPVRLLSLSFGKKRLGVKIVTNRGMNGAALKVQQFSEPWPLTGPVARILDAMVELQAAGGPAAALPELARALLCCLEEATIRPPAENVNTTKCLLENICAYLRDHHQQEVSREAVARQFGISPNYLSRVFQVHGQMTFSSYLMHVRTDRAKKLLGTYRLKLDDVAAQCGYRDTAYFCRVFKRLAKITPASYRAQFRLSPEPLRPAEYAE